MSAAPPHRQIPREEPPHAPVTHGDEAAQAMSPHNGTNGISGNGSNGTHLPPPPPPPAPGSDLQEVLLRCLEAMEALHASGIDGAEEWKRRWEEHARAASAGRAAIGGTGHARNGDGS
jgi:hypothetical protein